MRYVNTTSCNPNTFSFGLCYVISKVFVADFEHTFACWERSFRIKTTFVVVIILNYLTSK